MIVVQTPGPALQSRHGSQRDKLFHDAASKARTAERSTGDVLILGVDSAFADGKMPAAAARRLSPQMRACLEDEQSRSAAQVPAGNECAMLWFGAREAALPAAGVQAVYRRGREQSLALNLWSAHAHSIDGKKWQKLQLRFHIWGRVISLLATCIPYRLRRDSCALWRASHEARRNFVAVQRDHLKRLSNTRRDFTTGHHVRSLNEPQPLKSTGRFSRTELPCAAEAFKKAASQ